MLGTGLFNKGQMLFWAPCAMCLSKEGPHGDRAWYTSASKGHWARQLHACRPLERLVVPMLPQCRVCLGSVLPWRSVHCSMPLSLKMVGCAGKVLFAF